MNLTEKIKAQGGRTFTRNKPDGEKKEDARFAVCVRNDDDGLLIPMKIYEVTISESGYFGVTDEAGERAVYPAEFFLLLDIPPQNIRDLKTARQTYR
ncbi:MAG: hypothetical protein ACR2F2_01550 [Pyrinomonadaceae bacterium]